MVLVLVSMMLAMPRGAAAAADPLSAITGYYAALNSQDLDGTLAWFADSFVFTGTGGQVVASSKAAWREYVRTDLFPHHFRFEVKTSQAAGDNVTYHGVFTADGQREQGVAYVDESLQGVVHDGKIQSLTVTEAREVSLAQEASVPQGDRVAAMPETDEGGASRAGWLAFGGLGGLLLGPGLCGLVLARRRA